MGDHVFDLAGDLIGQNHDFVCVRGLIDGGEPVVGVFGLGLGDNRPEIDAARHVGLECDMFGFGFGVDVFGAYKGVVNHA